MCLFQEEMWCFEVWRQPKTWKSFGLFQKLSIVFQNSFPERNLFDQTMYENLFIEEIHEPEIQLWQQHNKVVRKVLSDSLQLAGPTESKGGYGLEGAFAPHINAYPRISTIIFLPHLNFDIFWGFPLSYVVSWRGL